MRVPRVGVLSLQGDFERHHAALAAAGAEPVRVTLPRDLEGVDALVLPGGESTTLLRLIAATGLREPLERAVRTLPVLGTCAGVILLAADSDRLPAPTLGALDITVERNAYGRQVDSFTADVETTMLESAMLGVFIRAPRIRRVGSGVEVIARRRLADGTFEPVGVRQGRVVGLCFHPELTSDLRTHRWFLSEVAGFALPGGERPAHGRRPMEAA